LPAFSRDKIPKGEVKVSTMNPQQTRVKIAEISVALLLRFSIRYFEVFTFLLDKGLRHDIIMPPFKHQIPLLMRHIRKMCGEGPRAVELGTAFRR